MNKVYRVVWNCILGRYDVTSELSLRKKKTKSHHSKVEQCDTGATCLNEKKKTALLFSLLFISSSVYSEDIIVPFFTPEVLFQQQISNTGNILTGDFSNITRGAAGYVRSTLGNVDRDLIVSGADLINFNRLALGAQTKVIEYTDSITGNKVSVNVFNSENMQSTPASDLNVFLSVPVGKDGQYVDRRFFVMQPGSDMTVSVGSTGADWTTDSANYFDAILKGTQARTDTQQAATTTSVFHVVSDNTATGNTTLNYNSKTIVSLGNNNNAVSDYAVSFVTDDYRGKFTSVIGEQNVTNLSEFQAYNNALIEAIVNNKVVLNDREYANQLALALNNRNTTQEIIFKNDIPADDAMNYLVNKNQVAFIQGDGSRSVINIGADANIQAFYTDSSLIRLTNGATLNNNGTIGSAGATIFGTNVVSATNSIINNSATGVIDAGTNREIESFATSQQREVSTGDHTAIFANGRSTIVNDGIINTASSTSTNTVTQLSDTASFTNNGVINMAASPEGAGATSGYQNRGILSQGNSVANNNGLIYIGRKAQRLIGETVDDVLIKMRSYAAYVSGNGTFNNNINGQIIIGQKASNSIGIDARGANATVNQDGFIYINGESTEPAGINIGMSSTESARNINNTGRIIINGTNAVGVRVLADNTKANDSAYAFVGGEIDINNGVDDSGRANYGLWVEGNNASAELAGTINLSGDGAIGVHARNQGVVNVSDNGKINFMNGENQIGYYIFGLGSGVNNISANKTGVVESVTTAGSTLYRIDSGANFTGVNPSTLESTGTDSTIIQVSGENSTFNSGALLMDIRGDGATGVRVEGGATGEIAESNAILNLSGTNTTAGIVDGYYYGIDGVATGEMGKSKLTSMAELTTGNTASGAYGYIVRNGGELIHKGVIDLTQNGSTGVSVDGGTLTNENRISVNGTAVTIHGSDSYVYNTGTVNAIDGTAAYLLGEGASLTLSGHGETSAAGTAHGILLDTGATALKVSDAVINMADDGSGNAIENKAEISGIQLKNTTINVGNGAGVRTGASMAATNSGLINVNGSGTGLLFENVGGVMTDNALDMSDSSGLTINVNSENGKGIVANSSQDLKTGASVNVNHASGGAALVVKGTTRSVEQNGNLISKSQTSPVVDINNGNVATFINGGNIQADSALQKAISVNSGNGIHFTNLENASVIGQVNLLAGNNTVLLMGGSEGNDFTTGNGDDNFILKDVALTDTAFTSLDGGLGNNILSFDNSSYLMKDVDSIKNMNNIGLTNGSVLILDNVSFALGVDKDDNASTGFTLDSNSQLQINSDSEVVFNSLLKGEGEVTVNTTGNRFDFTSNSALNAFDGTLALGHSVFDLSGNNTLALNSATLKAGNDSRTIVGEGVQTIAGLVFDGGTLGFDTGTPGEKVAKNSIHTTEMLNLLGGGSIEVNVGSIDNSIVNINNTLSVMEQDDSETLLKLASSDAVVQGSAGNLVLKDQHGNIITDSSHANIEQNGIVVAKGTYDYRLTGGDNSDGLYINYGLTQVELLASGDDALVLNANGKSGAAADLSAKITGTGDLTISSAAAETVSLSNADNDYSGNTAVRGGTLRMDNDNVLGNTSSLQLAADTALDMSGHRQTIGALETFSSSSLNLNGGELTVAQGGTSAGALTGDGALNLSAGTLTIVGNNQNLRAKTTVNKDATAVLNGAAGLGIGDIINAGILDLRAVSGDVVNAISDAGSLIVRDNSDIKLTGNNVQFSGDIDVRDSSRVTVSRAEQIGGAAVSLEGTLAIDTESDWQLLNTLGGTGGLEKHGAGAVTLTSTAAYTGQTDITGGGLILGHTDAPVSLQSERINIGAGAYLAGNGSTAGVVNNAGSLFVGSPAQPAALMARAATLASGSTFTVGGELNNSGDVYVGRAGEVAGNELTVNGNYAGDNGALYFNTALAGDSSLTDHMTVNGDTRGTTRVSVLNAGGTGAQTLNGIELIQVNGTSAGEFTQEGRIVAGAYDYSLVRGNAQNSGNWYLTSSTVAEPEKPVDPETPVKPGENNRRPEAGSYTANLAASNNMFITRLHDRMGGTPYIDARGEYQVSSLWMRQEGGHNRARDASGQLSTQSNRYVMQLGGDLAHWSNADTGSLHVGVMAGYGNNRSNTRSSTTGYASRGTVDGYTTGVYGTWFADENEKTGLYVDSWAQYSWFNNSVKGEGLGSETYKSKGVTASVESGYTFLMGTNEAKTKTFYLQPKAQATWMGVKADDHRESNGTRVSGKGNDNLQTRLGARATLEGQNGKKQTFQLFTEASWLHNTEDYGVTMNGAEVKQAGAKNIAELKVGVEGNLSRNVNIWGNVGQQVGDKGYSDTGVTLGLKYSF